MIGSSVEQHDGPTTSAAATRFHCRRNFAFLLLHRCLMSRSMTSSICAYANISWQTIFAHAYICQAIYTEGMKDAADDIGRGRSRRLHTDAAADSGTPRGRRDLRLQYSRVPGNPQPTASRHLAYLRPRNISSRRRKDGLWVHYKLARSTSRSCACYERGHARALALRCDWKRSPAARSADGMLCAKIVGAPRMICGPRDRAERAEGQLRPNTKSAKIHDLRRATSSRRIAVNFDLQVMGGRQ